MSEGTAAPDDVRQPVASAELVAELVEQLRCAEELLAALAADYRGFLHDVHNAATAIEGQALLARSLSVSPEANTDLDEIVRAAGRAAALATERSRRIGSRPFPGPAVDPGEFVSRARDSLALAGCINSRIDTRTVPAASTGPISFLRVEVSVATTQAANRTLEPMQMPGVIVSPLGRPDRLGYVGWLPVTTIDAGAGKARARVGHVHVERSDGGRPRAVVVDDEMMRVRFFTVLLRRVGFDVAGVGTAQEAIAARFAGPTDLIVSDVALPGRSGYEIADEIAQRERDAGVEPVPVLWVSGGPPADRALTGDRAFLGIPFTLADLEAALEQLLAPWVACGALHLERRTRVDARE